MLCVCFCSVWLCCSFVYDVCIIMFIIIVIVLMYHSCCFIIAVCNIIVIILIESNKGNLYFSIWHILWGGESHLTFWVTHILISFLNFLLKKTFYPFANFLVSCPQNFKKPISINNFLVHLKIAISLWNFHIEIMWVENFQ